MRQGGVTLVEMMAVIAIGIILVGIGAPSFKGMLARQSIGSESSGLLADLVLTREEAKNAGSPATLCASNNGTSCTASDWRDGHIVFRDGGVAGVVDGSDSVLRMAPAAKTGVTIGATVQGSGDEYGESYLQFDDQGKPGSDAALQFTTCYTGELPQQIVVRRNGHITASKGSSPCA